MSEGGGAKFRREKKEIKGKGKREKREGKKEKEKIEGIYFYLLVLAHRNWAEPF